MATIAECLYDDLHFVTKPDKPIEAEYHTGFDGKVTLIKTSNCEVVITSEGYFFVNDYQAKDYDEVIERVAKIEGFHGWTPFGRF